MPVGGRGFLLLKGDVARMARVLARGWAGAGGAELSEGLSELVAQPLVVLGQFAVAGVGSFQPSQQGCVTTAVVCRHRRARSPAAEVA